jgi:hypothetical protein
MNMSYCRFENTVRDMRGCISALNEAGWDMEVLKEDASKDYEQPAMDEFIELCKEVANNEKENENE